MSLLTTEETRKIVLLSEDEKDELVDYYTQKLESLKPEKETREKQFAEYFKIKFSELGEVYKKGFRQLDTMYDEALMRDHEYFAKKETRYREIIKKLEDSKNGKNLVQEEKKEELKPEKKKDKEEEKIMKKIKKEIEKEKKEELKKPEEKTEEEYVDDAEVNELEFPEEEDAM